MIRGETLTAIIPARGGSKSIPRKNLIRIHGETLVERAIRLARESNLVDRILVSTDDDEIYAIAKASNAAAPNLRPAHLASDSARTLDVVLHLVDDAKIESGYLLVLQVTTPLRTVADLRELCWQFERNPSANAVASIVRHSEPHPNKLMKVEDGYLESYLGKDPSVPRQDLPAVYAINGAFYIASLRAVLEQRTLLPKRTLAFEMPPERSVNLDEPLDLLLLETILSRGAA